MGERLAAAETWIDSHDARCEERYGEIKSSVDGIDDRLKWLVRSALGVVLSLVAWMAVQLYTTSQSRISDLEQRTRPSVAVITPSAAR